MRIGAGILRVMQIIAGIARRNAIPMHIATAAHARKPTTVRRIHARAGAGICRVTISIAGIARRIAPNTKV